MKKRFADILDQALAQELSGLPQDQVLHHFPQHAQQLEPLLDTAHTLNCLHPVALPPAALLEEDRRNFLQAVDQMDILPVSPGLMERINNWMTAVIPFFVIKHPLHTQEKRKMSPIFVNLALMLVMLVASAGGTVAFAASSLPDSPLYPVKLAVEQIQVSLLADPERLAYQHLALAQRRSEEILQQAQRGAPPEQSTTLKLQQHFKLALQYSAQLGEMEITGLLTQAQHMIQAQLQEMAQVQSRLKAQQQDPLAEPLRILQQTQARVQAGLDDPLLFREQTRSGFGEASGNPDCPLGECLPTGDQYQYRHRRSYTVLRFNRKMAGDLQPEEIVEPDAEDLAGSDVCPDDACLPVGDENRYGQDSSDVPGYGPGEPGGNPDPDSSDCEPSGDEHKYGQQPGQPGPGQPGGNPECPLADCDPEGDQHQEGQPPDPGGGSGSGGSGGGDSSGCGGEGSGGQARP